MPILIEEMIVDVEPEPAGEVGEEPSDDRSGGRRPSHCQRLVEAAGSTSRRERLRVD
jgi:hypothetical protein